MNMHQISYYSCRADSLVSKSEILPWCPIFIDNMGSLFFGWNLEKMWLLWWGLLSGAQVVKCSSNGLRQAVSILTALLSDTLQVKNAQNIRWPHRKAVPWNKRDIYTFSLMDFILIPTSNVARFLFYGICKWFERYRNVLMSWGCLVNAMACQQIVS